MLKDADLVMTTLAEFSTALFAVCMIAAGTGDVLSRRIPNLLVLVLAMAFVPLAWAQGMPRADMLLHAAAGIAVLVAGFALFSIGVLGGGDAKLMGAAAAWLGVAGLPQFLFMTVMAGGLLGLVLLGWSLVAFEAGFGRSRLSRRLSALRPSVPYGYGIAAGAILAVPGSWLAPAGGAATWLTQI